MNNFYIKSGKAFLIGALFIIIFSLQSIAQSGNILSVDGTNSFMSVADHADLDVAPGQSKTITCLVKTTSTAASRIIAKRTNSNTLNPSTPGITGTGYEIWMGSGANAGKVAGNAVAWNTVSSASQTFSTTGYNAVASNDGSWHHLAAVFDNTSTNKTVTFYVDGINPNARAGTFSGTYDFSTGVALVIGAATNNSNYFTGQFDNVRIWNKAMTPAELAADITATVSGPATDLLAGWDFENVVGSTVPDISGNNHPGTLNGNATIVPLVSSMQFSSTSLVQTELPVGQGDADQRIIAVNVATTGNANPLSLTALSFTMTGTTAISDATSIKIYYTGTSNRFNTNTLFATVAPAAGTITANGTQTLLSGNNYFWIAYDVLSTATEGNLLDATCEGVIVGGNSYPLSNPNNTVAGTRTILLSNTLLFAPGDAGSSNYRIPAIITAADGSLVTVTDKRWNGAGDLPAKIDPVSRRSTDGGKTWSAPVTMANFGAPNGAGDAALVLDKNTGNIICLVAANNGLFASTQANPIKVLTIRSTDNGISWGVPVDITAQLYGPNPGWKGLFVGSGRAHQLRDGTLAAAIAVRENVAGVEHLNNYMILSSDGGTTWTAAPGRAELDGDESKVVELNNGSIMMSIRNAGVRRFNITTDRGLTWGTAYNQPAILDPNCDGDFIRYTSTLDGYNKNRLLQSIPYNSSTRKNVSVLLSTDEGASWSAPKTIYPQASAYSSITILPDGTIGMYYENGEYNTPYEMYFVRFSLYWLTNGADTYIPANVLPLSLLSFKGGLSNNKTQVDLQWTTVNEFNVSHFEIEFSSDGINYSKAGSITANNTPVVNNYSFSHTNIPATAATIYYRLKSVDVDARFKYSQILKFNLGNSQSVSIYPNPVTDKLLVNAPAFKKGKLQIIAAGNGSIVKSMMVPEDSFTVDMSALSKGTYIIKLMNESLVQTMKIVKE